MRINDAGEGAIWLGRQGENLATRIRFDTSKITDAFGTGGTFTLLARRRTDPGPYPVEITVEDDRVIWDVTEADTAIDGAGQCELRYYQGDVLVKTMVWTTKVSRCIEGDGIEPPEPYETWVEQVLNSAESAAESAAAAEAALEAMDVDPTLTIEDSPADAMATGRAVASAAIPVIVNDADYTITGSIDSSGNVDPTATTYRCTDFITVTGPCTLKAGWTKPGLVMYDADKKFLKRITAAASTSGATYELGPRVRYIRCFKLNTLLHTAVAMQYPELDAKIMSRAVKDTEDHEELTERLIPTRTVTVNGVTSSSSNYREYTFEYDPRFYYEFPWQPTLNIFYSNGDDPETYQLRRYLSADLNSGKYVLNGLALAGATGHGLIKAATHKDYADEFYIRKVRKRQATSWENKTAIIVGDSITKGGYDTIGGVYRTVKNPFAEAACREMGINVLENTSVGGASFGLYNGDTAHYIYTQVSPMASNAANLIILRGGGNDFTKGLPIGTIANMARDATYNSSSPSTGAEQTLYGEMYRVCSFIMNKCKSATIVFVTMLHRGVKVSGSFKDDYDTVAVNSEGLHLIDYRNAIIEFCAQLGIPCCDMFMDAMLNPRRTTHVDYSWDEDPDTLVSTIYTHPAPFFYKDLQHPLERSHERMAHLLAEEIARHQPIETVSVT